MYGRSGAALVFGSSLDCVTGYPGMRRELTPQGLFDYLYYHVSPGPQTVLAGLMRLPAGHCIEFGGSGAGTATPYWTMQFDERPGRSLAELEREFLALVETSVRDAAQGASTGAFLSGGTDSSTVSGMLGRTGMPARTFSIGFDAAGYDEMSYARIAAKHFGCEQHEYYVTPQDVVDAVPRIAASYDQPFGNASAIPTYYCARFAREHGITRLLAGDGGDELFGGNERYGKYYLLGLYQHVPAALRRGLLEPLLLGLPTDRVPLMRKLRSYVEQARPPMPKRYTSYNLLTYLGHENVLTPEFLASVDTQHPEALLAEAHAPYADASLINQMLGIDLRFILADGDLPKVTHMCDLAGVDVAFPLLDERVIDFSSQLASDLKLRRTQLRWFFKHALRNFLPPEIITKQKHGFGLPVGTWLVGHKPLYDLAVDSIGPLRRRNIVRQAFLDELLSKRLHEHPAYFGTMVWILMMLGIWLESRKL
jgi:asparagine synthase (glutamine-hydrolysing)